MRRTQLWFHVANDLFEPLMQSVNRRDNSVTYFRQDRTRNVAAISVRQGANAQFHLVQPKTQIGQECLQIGNDSFELRADFVVPLPPMKEILKLGICISEWLMR